MGAISSFLEAKSDNKQQYYQNIQANEGGFSLIELLFVITILAILIPIATLTYSGIQTKITTDLVNVDLKVIGSAARTYEMKNGTFPISIQTLVDDGYLDELPKDKFVSGGVGYRFIPSSNPFKVWSVGPNKIDDGGAADDIVLVFAP
jgi:general secretion pathway protein G